MIFILEGLGRSLRRGGRKWLPLSASTLCAFVSLCLRLFSVKTDSSVLLRQGGQIACFSSRNPHPQIVSLTHSDPYLIFSLSLVCYLPSLYSSSHFTASPRFLGEFQRSPSVSLVLSSCPHSSSFWSGLLFFGKSHLGTCATLGLT